MSAPSRLVISSISTGLQTYEKPFLINNDAFPVLDNALCWRRRLIKKPGSFLLGRLQRELANTGASPFLATISPAPLVDGASTFTIGSVVLTDSDLSAGGLVNLTSSDGSYTGTLNRTTGALTINHPVIVATAVIYIPGLPVMGIEEFENTQSASAPIDFPENVYFDTVYSYRFNGANFTDNSFYKTNQNPVNWSGANYQQFDSCNYFRALWVTNNNPGAQFMGITNIAAIGGPPSVLLDITTSAANGLGVGDVVFINEVGGMTQANGVTGVVTIAGNPVRVSVTSNTFAGYTGGGIIQSLTKDIPGAGSVGDGIRWYDGQGGTLGFVNFAPPLASINPPTGTVITYLIGARIIIPFGNRLLAIGTFEATSAEILAGGTGTYFPSRIRYCEVTATPFYANILPNTLPANSFEPNAWASNIQGFGGFIDLDTVERIISAAVTQGSLILGLESQQRRLSNTGIETDPFSAQVINPEYGTAGTHSIIPMDKGILTAGEYGFIISSSYDAKRFDLPIIQQVFQINPTQNGFERISGGRDFGNEVVYFSYPSIFGPEDTSSALYPDTTLVYNYRENSFAVWYEAVTTYGIIKEQEKTWSALTTFTWGNWNLPWNSPAAISQFPFVGFGTPQGFVMLKWYYDSTNDPSIMIQAVSTLNADGTYSITSVNHNLYPGAYVGFLSPTSAGPEFIGQVAHLGDGNLANPSRVFSVNFDASATPGNIVAGTWKVSIVDQPFIQSKQFPVAWGDARKTRIGAQKYFLDTTEDGEFTVDILGSQSPVPLNNNQVNNPLPSLQSNAIVRTRPDDSLGLNDSAQNQAQIWHRLASSVIGDTVQLQMTLSDEQMRDVDIATSPWVLHSIILDLYPSRTLA